MNANLGKKESTLIPSRISKRSSAFRSWESPKISSESPSKSSSGSFLGLSFVSPSFINSGGISVPLSSRMEHGKRLKNSKPFELVSVYGRYDMLLRSRTRFKFARDSLVQNPASFFLPNLGSRARPKQALVKCELKGGEYSLNGRGLPRSIPAAHLQVIQCQGCT